MDDLHVEQPQKPASEAHSKRGRGFIFIIYTTIIQQQLCQTFFEFCIVLRVHWIDTGDYHYITKFWLERLGEPFLLSLFDNHPDDGQDSLGGGLLSCGNWVAACKDKLPLMRGSFRNTASLPRSLPVYLSIDLDVLSPQWARTDWSQGEMSLPELIQAIDAISKEHRVLGVDICGGLTVAKGARPADLSINVRTRMLLTDYLSSHPLVSG